MATELGLTADAFKVRGPQEMSLGYRPAGGNWNIQNDVNILLGKPDQPFDPNHLFDLWGLSQEE